MACCAAVDRRVAAHSMKARVTFSSRARFAEPPDRFNNPLILPVRGHAKQTSKTMKCSPNRDGRVGPGLRPGYKLKYPLANAVGVRLVCSRVVTTKADRSSAYRALIGRGVCHAGFF
jgi:hypothetical protein